MHVPLFNPNIPRSRVETIIAGDMSLTAYNNLVDLGISVLFVDKCEYVLSQLATHADLFCNYLGNDIILVAKDQNKLFKDLTKQGLNVKQLQVQLNPKYPGDVLLNVAIFGNNVLCNPKVIDNDLSKYINNNNYKVIPTSQGYTKCSTCIVNENAIITDDESIAKSCKKLDVDVLMVEKGSICLPGFEYGFIGGTCVLIDSKTLAFFGNVEKHKQFNEIKSFTANYGVDIISLDNNPLVDIGGAIPIFECV